MEYQNLILDRFQEKAIRLVEQEESVIVSAPTGSGKTIIAEYAIEKSLQKNGEIIYTAPIKALSNQKFRDFTHKYGDQVGIVTGDVSLRPTTPIVIMTTEIFRNALFEDPHRFDKVRYLILDEIHYLDDSERGSVWEESLIFAPLHIKVLCLSATVPNVKDLAAWIGQIRDTKVHIVQESKRPVPLSEFCFLQDRGVVKLDEAMRLLPKKKKQEQEITTFDPQVLRDILDYLRRHSQMPCLYFVFSRKDCEAHARQYATASLLDPHQTSLVRTRLKQFSQCYRVDCNPEAGLGSLLIRGIAYHHAGMMPAYKEVVEQLFTEGLVKVLFATETFALGINMPATSVVFSRLKKYDGISVRHLSALEYQQMSGRAGRRGLDSEGYVYANLHDHSITREEVRRILSGPLEPISSQFNLSYNTLLSLYERVGSQVINTCDKSFRTFQLIKETLAQGGKKEVRKITAQQRNLIKKKLAFLETLGYLTKSGLTSKGRFAARINGYELQTTEIFFGGLLENCDEIALFVILVAIVFEGKKGDRYGNIPKDVKKWAQKVDRPIASLQKLESMYGLEGLKVPDFHLSAAARAWARGASFGDLGHHCDNSPGDVIRTFRMAVQMCRHLRRACSDYQEFVDLLDRCLLAVNRDETNALKQLEAFTSLASLGKSPGQEITTEKTTG